MLRTKFIAAIGGIACLCVAVLPAVAADAALVEAAKKEGYLSYATNLIAPITQKALEEAFVKEYGLPDTFKFEGYTPSVGLIVSRAQQEITADKVKIDWIGINIAAFWTDLKSRGELVEYCSPEYAKIDLAKKLGLVDGGCHFNAIASTIFGLMWNPKYIKEDLTTWAQVADPKYKGQIVIGDALKVGSYLDTYIVLRNSGVWSDDWLAKLKAQDPFFEARSTTVRDKVMNGEFPIAVIGYAPRAYQVKDKVKLSTSYPTDGVVVVGTYAGTLKRAPHPNAAKLWTDFLFSKGGQELLIKLEAISSARSDVAVPADVAPYLPDLNKLKVIAPDWSKLDNAAHDKGREEFRAAFGK